MSRSPHTRQTTLSAPAVMTSTVSKVSTASSVFTVSTTKPIVPTASTVSTVRHTQPRMKEQQAIAKAKAMETENETELLSFDRLPRVSSRSRPVKGGTSIYIQGVQRKSNELIFKSLQKIHGIGPLSAATACRSFSRPRSAVMGNRSRDQLGRLEAWITERLVVESDRRRVVYENIKRLMSIGSQRGIRMRNGRPVRGQRTSTNANTAARLNRFRVK